jgi:hypothetical protein
MSDYTKTKPPTFASELLMLDEYYRKLGVSLLALLADLMERVYGITPPPPMADPSDETIT